METLYPGSTGVQRRFETDVVEVEQGKTYAGPGGSRLTFFRVEHASGADAHAIRLEWRGKVVAYSGDTAWTPGLVEASSGADLFICEAYVRDRAVPFHLSYVELLDHRSEIDSARIVLTHMGAEMLAAKDVEVERASDGLVVQL